MERCWGGNLVPEPSTCRDARGSGFSLADVSEITVSRIIRNKGPIADITRAKVMAAVRASVMSPIASRDRWPRRNPT